MNILALILALLSIFMMLAIAYFIGYSRGKAKAAQGTGSFDTVQDSTESLGW